jgi:hypothetical protein
MYVWCPDINGQRMSLTCIYRCKIKRNCVEYTKLYEEICNEQIEEKYIEKYGQPEYPLPLAMLRKQQNAEKKAKLDAKKIIETEKKTKKKAKEKLKNEKESAKLAKIQAKEQKKADKAKKVKRTRRTKEQMLQEQTIKVDPIIVTHIPEKQKRHRRTKAEMIASRIDKSGSGSLSDFF